MDAQEKLKKSKKKFKNNSPLNGLTSTPPPISIRIYNILTKTFIKLVGIADKLTYINYTKEKW